MANPPYPTRIAPEDAFDRLIGFEVDDASEVGRIVGHVPVTPRVCQPMGLVHGGVYAAIAESLASMGTAHGVMSDGKMVVGMSNNTSFMRPVTDGTLFGVAHAIHRGRTTWVWDVEMRDTSERLCAVSLVTIAVRDPR